MTESINPSTVPAPAGPYSQAVRVSAPGQWLHVSGQIGVRADGSLADGVEAQATVAWQNLLALLDAAGMGVQHLVKLGTFLVDREHLARVNPVRARFLGDARPASTLIVARELARPEWLFEIEAVAFRAD
ncbi:RidA family protein [Variovorax sp. JS1663]|uniref:RidA family protein n=1 Tax=Variovorax sp. JS1663 TaxID=1851577 RepID=UPI000B346754|nr:RidA family protein [Variovorax sp. JS1663]OUL98404.1 enamine deaminase RidA [Variovorax sp. JS1663]